jgi:hypothetical protein
VKLITAIAKHECVTLPPELADYAIELGLGDFDAGIIRALRYAKEEELHVLGRLRWWVHGEAIDCRPDADG